MRLRALRGLLPTVFLLLVSVTEGRAQTISTALLEGAVRDEGGLLLSDVVISVTSETGGPARSVVTTHEGSFRIPNLLPSTYTVVLERLGYRPKRVEHVPLGPGSRLALNVTLRLTPPPIDQPEVEVYPSVAAGSRAGIGQTLSAVPIARQRWFQRELGELAPLSTASTTDLEVEGLPTRLSTVTVDGLPYTPAAHPYLPRSLRFIALPLSALNSAELSTADPDVEWTGFAAGNLAAQTRSGSGDFHATTFGQWSGGSLQSSKYFDTANLSNNSIWGGALLSGSVIRDTATYVLGIEARKLELAMPSPWELRNGNTDALISTARSKFGADLSDFPRPFVAPSTVVSAFGRFDWQLANDNSLSVRLSAGQMPRPAVSSPTLIAAAPASLLQGNDLLFTASLFSALHRTWSHQIRVGLNRSTREFDPTAFTGEGSEWPATQLVADGLTFGIDPRLPSNFARTDFTLAQAIEIPRRDHNVKLGLDGMLSTHNDGYSFAPQGTFTFGGANDFGRSEGSFIRTVGSKPNARFTVGRYGAFAQDTWRAAPDITVVAGIRVDLETLPKKSITPSSVWFALTHMANDSVPRFVPTVSPRLGLVWDVTGDGNLIVHANAGVYAQPADPTLLAEAVTRDTDWRVLRGAGALGTWPAEPSALALAPAARGLSLLGLNFRSPATSRASLGISRRLGSATLHFAGSYRDTKYLPRRADLNLLNVPAGQDQNGRPIFGPLVKIGELITVATPNRRFNDYDVVSAINTDGWSHYWGLTAALEKPIGAYSTFFASYTYSSARDNWLGSRYGTPDAQLTPFPDNVGTDWREGVSDFDLTHKVAAGLDWRSGGSLQPHVSTIYHYQSGYPFTPGFRPGMDVNGDGSGNNDPAFIDEAVSGVSDLVRAWPCLQQQSGHIAERNSCRQSGVHSLDVRAGLTVSRTSGLAVELFADGINLIESETGEPDRALYLVDGARQLVFNQTTGSYTIPFVANPNFGKPLHRFGNGRLLRIGLQVNY